MAIAFAIFATVSAVGGLGTAICGLIKACKKNKK